MNKMNEVLNLALDTVNFYSHAYDKGRMAKENKAKIEALLKEMKEAAEQECQEDE